MKQIALVRANSARTKIVPVLGPSASVLSCATVVISNVTRARGAGRDRQPSTGKTSFVPVGEKCRTLPRLASGVVSVLSFLLPETLVTIKGARITPRKDTGEGSNVSRVLRTRFGTTFNNGIGLCSYWEHIWGEPLRFVLVNWLLGWNYKGNPCALLCGDHNGIL